jgi:protease-4
VDVAAVAAAGIVTSTTTTTRNKPRRPRTVIGVALAIYVGVAALFVVVLSASFGPGAGGGPVFGARIAVVELDGPIIEVEDLVRELRAHRDNPLVRAVVIRINSPGGVVGPTQEVHAALTRMREARKPVVASLGAVAASGGYYVAVAADRIYANPGTLTGSIGVIMRLATLDGLMKKVGVDYVVVKSGRLKDIGNIARAMTPEERQVLQVLLDDVHGQFITAVVEGRKLDRAQVLGFADGRIVSGAQAKALNMVDVLGGLEEALDGAATLAGLPKPPMVVGPRRRLSVFDILRNQLAQAGWLGVSPALPVFKTPLYLMD